MHRFLELARSFASAAVARAVLAGAFVCMNVCELPAEEVATRKEETKPKVTLSPEKEAKLAEVLKKAAEAKRKFWTTRMKKEVERVTKATGLGTDGAKALELAAEQAADLCLEGWTTTFGDGWRRYFSEQPADGLETDQILSQLEQSVQIDWFGEYVRPFEHPKWEEGLRRTLSGEQIAVWEKAEKERNEAVAKEAAGVLKAMVDQTSDQQRKALLAKGTAIKTALALSKERAQKLDELAGTASAAAADGLRKRAERMLLTMDDDQRQQILKTRQFYLGLDEKDLTAQQTAWKEGVAALLSPEEERQLEGAHESFAAKRAVVMGQIMITQLDEKVAFTASQRERLQPIAERLTKTQTALFADVGQETFYRINPQLLLDAGTKATEEEMKAILDARQWKRWREACLAKDYRSGRVVLAAKKTDAAAGAKPGTRAAEPEDLENAFSEYLHDRTTNERKQLLTINLLRAEDAARVAGLVPEAVGRLETAARGAAEEVLVTWKPGMENMIRTQVRDATPENVKQRLAGMENYSYGRNSSTTASIWEKTVKSELTAAERAAWQKELDARTAYRTKAIAALIMSEFDRKIPLTAEQWTTLEPRIAGMVKDYEPDIGMMFSSSYPWYLQSYSMFIPFAAVPEKELKGILGKEQWERWSESEENGNTSNYWENVQRNHTQRTKEKAK